MLRGRRKKIGPGSGASPTSGRPNSSLFRLISKPFSLAGDSDNPHRASQTNTIQCGDGVLSFAPTEKEVTDLTSSPPPAKRKGVFGRLIPRAKPGKIDGEAQSTPTPPVETSRQEEQLSNEILPSSTLKERASRLYDILNTSNLLPMDAELENHLAGADRLDVIPEKTMSFQALPTFSPFAGCSAFGCNGVDDSDRSSSPSKTEHIFPVDNYLRDTSSGSYDSTPLSDNLAVDTDVSPLLTVLMKVADSFNSDPHSMPPPVEAPPEIPQRHLRSESYRLGYLLAHIGLLRRGITMAEPSSLGLHDENDDLRAVLNTIKDNAGSDQLAFNSLAFIASEFAATSKGAIDREALERGYRLRVSELQHPTDDNSRCRATGKVEPELVAYSKDVLHAIENVLYDPFDPSKSDIMGVYWRDSSFLSSEENDEKEVTAVETALSETSKEQASSTQERSRSGGLVEMLSLFRKSDGSQTDDSSESSDSSSGSSSSSDSSGVDISVASKLKGVSYVKRPKRTVNIDIDSTIESKSSEGHRTCEISNSNSRSACTEEPSTLDASVACSTVRSDEDSLPTKYSLDKSSMSTEPSVLSKRVSFKKSISPYGFLSFIRAVSTIGTDSISTDDDQRSNSNEAGEVGIQSLALDEVMSSDPEDFEVPKRTVNITNEQNGSSTVTDGKVAAKMPVLAGRRNWGHNASGKGGAPISLFRMPASSHRPPLAPARRSRQRKAPSKDPKELTTAAFPANETNLVNITITKVHEGDSECIEMSTSAQKGGDEPTTVDKAANVTSVPAPHLLPRFSILASTRSAAEDEVEVALADEALQSFLQGSDRSCSSSILLDDTKSFDGPMKAGSNDRIFVLQRSIGSKNTRNATDAGYIEIEHQQQRLELGSSGKIPQSPSLPSIKSESSARKQTITSDLPSNIQSSPTRESNSYCNSQTNRGSECPQKSIESKVRETTVCSAGMNRDDISSDGSKHDFTGVSINQTDDSTRNPPSSLTPSRESDAASRHEEREPEEDDDDGGESDSQSETDTLATSDIASLLELLVGSDSEPRPVSSAQDGKSHSSACDVETVTHSEPGIVRTAPSSGPRQIALNSSKRQQHRRSSSVPPILLRLRNNVDSSAAPSVPAVE